MKRNIKMALCFRVVVLLIGPGLHYLLTNTSIDRENNADASLNDDYTAQRRLLSVGDHETRDKVDSRSEVDAKNDSAKEINKTATRPVNLRFTVDEVTRSGKKSARMFLHVLAACYCFWMLAVVCDEYFIASIETLCQKLHLREDVAGATFLAMATSSPELFINCWGTFITEGDIGVGTIVGSAVFNILAVPACCGLFTRTGIQLDWWSVSRDCTFYGFSVIALIATIYDNVIMWYEAAFLVVSYGIYLIIMYYNDEVSEKAKIFAWKVQRRIHRQPYLDVTEIAPFFIRGKMTNDEHEPFLEFSEPSVKLDESSNEDGTTSPWKIPPNSNVLLFFIRWPITLTLWCTIPNSRRFKSFYVFSFINCVIWIGVCSYFIVFLSTDVDSVMGLTFLAAGTSIPEAVSSVIVTAQGYGSMGISNSIGSNIFDILLCLGFPWLIKTLIAPSVAGKPWITLQSTGITYSTVSLITTLFALYLAFLANKFMLDRKIGISCLTLYVIFLIFASLVEFNVLFPVTTRISSY